MPHLPGQSAEELHVQNGVLASPFPEACVLTAVIVLQVVIVLGLGIAALFLKAYLPSYLTEKGKNLATKEDIRGITTQIESVKASMGARLHTHQVRYEYEIRTLMELSEKLANAESAVSKFAAFRRPDDERKRVHDTLNELHLFAQARRPFFPEEIGLALLKFDGTVFNHIFFRNMPDKEGEWPQDTETMLTIKDQMLDVQELIAKRIKDWEKFEPGP